ncbi:glycosyltransferase family 4 protein [Marinimicrobium agarilyticum]|uniref:glycosyltransferase family 4 protein n=1 Tax=Marinimicrobium agarilyticum TaxID=306546 RepID=UPI0003F5E5E4|nr:glycosyltransferase family 4 protein [Marinimicrobium agarilyticum]
MKILCVCAKFPTTIQTWLINYIKAVENDVENLDILSLEKGEAEYNERIDSLNIQRVYTAADSYVCGYVKSIYFLLALSFKKRLWFFLKNLWACSLTPRMFVKGLVLIKHLRIEAPDVIHCHSEKAAVFCLPLLLSFRAPIVLTFHGLPPFGIKDIKSQERDLLLSYVSLVLVNTSFAEKQIRSLSAVKFKTKIVPQGICINEFPFKPNRKPKPSTSLNLLTIGRVDKFKGHEFVLRAIPRLLSKGYQISYRIIGLGLYKDHLEDIVSTLNLQENVFFLGQLTGDNLLNELYSADLFILPSIHKNGQWAETQGIVIQEAQACGTLVSASISGGIPECIEHNKTGFLFTSEDWESIEATIEAVANGSDKLRKLKQRARRDVEENYTIDKMRDNLLIAYNQISKN